MPTVLKKLYVYTTDKGRQGTIRLSEAKAAAGGFSEPPANSNIPPLGIPVKRLRHVGVRMTDGTRYELPVPSRESALYEALGAAVTWVISGTSKTGKVVGSTGEKTR
ncbi:MAG: hypothetical protein AB1457_18005 [Chloroflexota bacterium]